MKNLITIGLMLCFLVLFTGCMHVGKDNTENMSEVDTSIGAEDNVKNQIATKEIVFFNYPQESELQNAMGKDESRVEYYTIDSCMDPYEYNIESDTLYAIQASIFAWKGDGDELVPDDFPNDYPIKKEDETSWDYEMTLEAYYMEKLLEILEKEEISILKVSRKYYEGGRFSGKVIFAITAKDLYRIFDGEESEMHKWHVNLQPVVRLDFEDIAKELGWDGTSLVDEWALHNIDLVQSVVGEEPHVTITVEVE